MAQELGTARRTTPTYPQANLLPEPTGDPELLGEPAVQHLSV